MENSKAQPYDTTIGKVYFRAEDHQMVRPIPILRGKAPAAMKNPEDFYDIVDLVDGESVMNPPDLLGCKLGPYTEYRHAKLARPLSRRPSTAWRSGTLLALVSSG